MIEELGMATYKKVSASPPHPYEFCLYFDIWRLSGKGVIIDRHSDRAFFRPRVLSGIEYRPREGNPGSLLEDTIVEFYRRVRRLTCSPS
jgi:hypothetical protein